MRGPWFNILAIAIVGVALSVVVLHNLAGDSARHLLNVSYDPTRELYQDINGHFVSEYEQQHGQRLAIQQAHGGSSRQARSVIQGQLDADVVTLALPSDVEALHQKGLIADGWSERLPTHSVPYTSTIVFVVRRANPAGIHDWPDLVKPGVGIVTPNPKTSGNGKLSVLAAWGSVIVHGGDDAAAAAYLKDVFHHVVVLGDGARDAAKSFAQDEIGDVHLTWENEALREAGESSGKLEVVYPSVSIRAEPTVAWVDANVARHGTTDIAKAYLAYLFTDPVQELIAQHGYRAENPAVLARHRDHLPDLQLFPVTLLGSDWSTVQTRFFADLGIYDTTVDAIGSAVGGLQGK